MSKRASEDLLAELHLETAKLLLSKVRSGEITPSELATAVKMLKDNKIEAQITPGDTLHQLYASLPDYDDEEIFN